MYLQRSRALKHVFVYMCVREKYRNSSALRKDKIYYDRNTKQRNQKINYQETKHTEESKISNNLNQC